MDSHGLIAWIIIGAVAGWLAGIFVKGGGFGPISDIVVGIIGAFVGRWLAGVLHIQVGGGWILDHHRGHRRDNSARDFASGQARSLNRFYRDHSAFNVVKAG